MKLRKSSIFSKGFASKFRA